MTNRKLNRKLINANTIDLISEKSVIIDKKEYKIRPRQSELVKSELEMRELVKSVYGDDIWQKMIF